MWLRVISIFMNCKGMHGWTDSHRDNRARLRVVELFFLCEAHQDVFNTHLLLLKHKNKQTNRTNFNNKNSIEIAIFMFTDLIRFRIMGQLTVFFSLSDETEVSFLGVTGIMNTATIAMLRL